MILGFIKQCGYHNHHHFSESFPSSCWDLSLAIHIWKKLKRERCFFTYIDIISHLTIWYDSEHPRSLFPFSNLNAHLLPYHTSQFFTLHQQQDSWFSDCIFASDNAITLPLSHNTMPHVYLTLLINILMIWSIRSSMLSLLLFSDLIELPSPTPVEWWGVWKRWEV